MNTRDAKVKNTKKNPNAVIQAGEGDLGGQQRAYLQSHVPVHFVYTLLPFSCLIPGPYHNLAHHIFIYLLTDSLQRMHVL